MEFMMIDRIASNATLEEFQKSYLQPNRPCILSAEFTKEWKGSQNWVDEFGMPDFTYLAANFGKSNVPVANCSKKHYNAHEKKEMLFGDFLSAWEHSLSANDQSFLLYLKDWHCQREFPNYRAYEVPKYFKSDWLNEWFDQGEQDDYRFVYMGPKGTWTAFHADVLRSYSWSANICGKKRWLLYPPGEEENLKDSFGNLPFDVTADEMRDEKKYPNFHKATKPIEVIQEKGEVLFVPSCWHHQVHNLEHTISINHNWTNAYGIDFMFNHLKAELLLVQREISDIKDSDCWDEQCQLLLKCTAGMDHEMFIKMLTSLMKPRLAIFNQSTAFLKESHSPSKQTANSQEQLCKINHALKRLEITCVPREHLKFENSEKSFTSTPEIANLPDLNFIRAKIKNVRFDLERLLYNFRAVCSEAKFESCKEFFIEGNELAKCVERALGANGCI
eukprot:Seg1697.5 transcript_id=Seg1697.5/GoldUCD/mRNA.D3Y31 product="JmjC domain-containing protein 4" protein_id=Seg1697.5/GoldUCD/D3Y31